MKTVLYIVLVYGIPLLMFIGIYIAIGKMMKKVIVKEIREYSKNAVVSIDVLEYLSDNESRLVSLGVMAWPLFSIFYLGTCIGDTIYDYKIKKNNESRIAPWFI